MLKKRAAMRISVGSLPRPRQEVSLWRSFLPVCEYCQGMHRRVFFVII